MTTLTAPRNCNGYEREPHLHNIPDEINAIGYTPEGWLNEYTLMCGYLENWEANNAYGTSIHLWYEGESYHVRRHDHKGNGRIFWYCFDTVDEARRCFLEAISDPIIPFKES